VRYGSSTFRARGGDSGCVRGRDGCLHVWCGPGVRGQPKTLDAGNPYALLPKRATSPWWHGCAARDPWPGPIAAFLNEDEHVPTRSVMDQVRVVEVDEVRIVNSAQSASGRAAHGSTDARLQSLEHAMVRIQARLDALETPTDFEKRTTTGKHTVGRAAPIALDDDEMPTEMQRLELAESIWEAPLILGMHPCGVAGRIFTWLLVLLNAALQGLLVFIIASAELDAPQITDGDIQDFGEWRRNSAHAAQYMDIFSYKSMAAQICDGTKSIVQSTSQQNAHDAITQYLGDREFGQGPLMAMLAVIVWSLSIFKEVCATLRLFDAVRCLPVGDGHPVVGKAGRGSLEVVNTTRMRKLIVALVCAARLCLAGLLLVYGGGFLAHTLEIDELILNGT
jgi:hypothetical protein